MRRSWVQSHACGEPLHGVRPPQGLADPPAPRRPPQDTKPSQYLARALRLAAPDWSLFLVAFACLGVNSLASLLLPRVQGGILDAVVRGDPASFRDEVTWLLGVSVASGVFGALRGLCFNLVGRRIACHVRNNLFRGMIRQDIAYFDAASTGDLTSRLSYDTGAMVAPCQTMLRWAIDIP